MATLKLGKREFELRLALNAIDEIQKKYGSLEEISKVTSIKDIAWILTAMINEANRYRAFDTNEIAKIYKPDDIATLITTSIAKSGALERAMAEAVRESCSEEKN